MVSALTHLKEQLILKPTHSVLKLVFPELAVFQGFLHIPVFKCKIFLMLCQSKIQSTKQPTGYHCDLGHTSFLLSLLPSSGNLKVCTSLNLPGGWGVGYTNWVNYPVSVCEVTLSGQPKHHHVILRFLCNIKKSVK